jgi:RimJ/RimL family protein N-acetyltransferase
MGDVIATTERLILRRWRESDREPFARMNADPRVMEFFPETLSGTESDRLINQIEADFEKHGFGPCAAELMEDHSFIGFVGLHVATFPAPFTPCVEIAWRLSAAHWGRGLATEGAREMARYAFEVLHLRELVAFTVAANVRSRRVMEKLGMTHNAADDFDHPELAEDQPLRRHVLYRLRAFSGTLWGSGP